MMTKNNNVGKFNMIFSTLEDLVPENHPVRIYDKAIDWSFIYPMVENLYSTAGRPSIDPIVLFKMVFLNYIDGIHSLRKTCERCKTDVAYRWFLRINFDEKVPDHSTYSQNLKRKFLETLAANNDNMQQENIYYAFTPKKGFRVIFLDSIIDYKLTSNGEISNEEFMWLTQELEKHAKDTVIVCSHVPIIEPFSSPNHKMQNEYEVRKLLKTHRNPLIVLQGHYHTTKIIQDDNMLVVACPSLVTYPNSFRVININSNKQRTLVDVYLKETNLKDIQSRSKLRLMGTERLYGEESDRNASFELKNYGD